MRVVLDTNVLLSALLTRGTAPDRLYEAWRDGRFELASCERQLDEIKRVSRRDFFRKRLSPGIAGRLVNDIRALALDAKKNSDLDYQRKLDEERKRIEAQAREAAGAEYGRREAQHRAQIREAGQDIVTPSGLANPYFRQRVEPGKDLALCRLKPSSGRCGFRS